jgi:hypothetical protein
MARMAWGRATDLGVFMVYNLYFDPAKGIIVSRSFPELIPVFPPVISTSFVKSQSHS